LLPGHLNIYIDTARDERPSQIRGQWILDTLLLTDYQTFSGQTKYDLQSATQLLHNTLQNLICNTGNYTLEDLHCQYPKYRHKYTKHILL